MSSIYLISKEMGVSPMTVSNALNYRKGVGEKTAERIREYAKKIGYRPSHMARALSNGRTATIGLCLRNSPQNPWVAGILEALNRKVHEAGYSLSAILTNGDLEQVKDALRQMDEHRVEASIVGPLGYTQEYLELADELRHLPHVVVFDAVDCLPVDHCMIDVYQGGLLAMRHLFTLGHTSIGYIGALQMETTIAGCRNRYSAYRDALEHQRLGFHDEWLLTQEKCKLQADGGSQGELLRLLRDLAAEDRMPTAWFCHNDWIAAQVIRVLYELGFSVPGDVSVVGFDNQPVCQVTTPAISSVGFDMNLYVQSISRILFERLAKPKGLENARPSDLQRVVVAPQLFVRQSTRALGDAT